MTPWAPPRRQALATLHAALDGGVRLVDTADCYSDSIDHVGANEALVAEALRTWPGDADDVLVATKGGRWRPGDGSWRADGRPEALRAACDASLRALGVERIGLYHLHAVDPEVPIEESVGALLELRDAGKVERIGLSNVDADHLATALDVAGDDAIASVQNALSPTRLDDLDLAVACGTAGRTFLAWAALHGVRTDDEAPAAFAVAAGDLGLTVRQVALAWARSLAATVVPIVGPVSPAEVAEGLAAPDQLADDERRALPAPRPRRRAAVAAFRGDELLLVRQRVGGREFWTLPGGGVDLGEDDETAARRELLEETGLEAGVLTWLCDAPCPVFLADLEGAGEPRLDPDRPDDDEVVGVAWLPVTEVADDWQVRVVLAARDGGTIRSPRAEGHS